MQLPFRFCSFLLGPGFLRSVIVVLLVMPATIYAQQFEEANGIFIRKGYKYSPGSIRYDTISVMDPVTGEVMYLPHTDYSQVANINGRRIYGLNEVTTPVSISTGQQIFEVLILQRIKEYISQLYFKGPDSISVRINLKNFVVDESGTIVYFELGGARAIIDGLVRDVDNGELPQRVNRLISELPPLKPATLNGVNVMSYADINLHRYKIIGAGTAITWVDDGSTYRE